MNNSIKKFFLCICSIIAFAVPCDSFAQIVTSISFNSNRIESAEYNRSVSYTNQEYHQVEDSLWVVEQYNVTRHYSTVYSHLGGANLRVNFSRPIGKNLWLTTGIGVDYTHFKVLQEFSTEKELLQTANFINTPAPATNLPSIPNFYNSPCDFFANYWSDIVLIPGHEIRNYSLLVPLELDYFYKETGLSGSVGLYFHTPFVSDIINDERAIKETAQGDDTICTYYRKETVDRSGRLIRNAQVGGKLGIQYMFLNGLAINASYMQDLTDVYIDLEYQNSPTWEGRGHSFFPQRVSIGARYYFKKKTTALPELK